MNTTLQMRQPKWDALNELAPELHMQHAGMSILECPICKATSVHQDRVEVFSCIEDSAETITLVDCQHGIIDGVAPSAGNPSHRRDGLRIIFECEMCGPTAFAWEIWQHKGETQTCVRENLNRDPNWDQDA